MTWSPLPGRPGHLASAEQMDMQVVHGLTAALTRVDDEAEARLVDALVLRDRLRDVEQASPQRVLGRRQLGHRFDVLAWEHEHMDRCLRVDVADGQHLVVLADKRGRLFVCRNGAEDAIVHERSRVARRWSSSTFSARTRSRPPWRTSGSPSTTTS